MKKEVVSRDSSDLAKLNELYALLIQAESADQSNPDNAIAAQHFRSLISCIERKFFNQHSLLN